MASIQLGDSSHNGMGENSPYRFSHANLEEADRTGSSWYLSRREIDEISPSRRDGIDLKKETYYRKSYCTYLQDLGMRLKVPQVTIATAIIFSHRFFLRQSHAKNDRRTIATVCMFLAGKVEETPRPLKDVILVSYEIIHKKDPAAAQRIKQRHPVRAIHSVIIAGDPEKEVYEQQKELILLGERVVLATLGFDLNVHHPYKPLVEAIKKFKVAQNALAQVAWNFVNDGLRTSLCLQFKPHHIAAGAIFLAAKFLKVKLPSDGEKVWWQEFDVTPRQLEEVSNQMLELYEQNRVGQQSHGNETEGTSVGGASHRATVKAPAAAEESSLRNGHTPPAGTTIVHHGAQANSATRPVPDQQDLDKTRGIQRILQNGSSAIGGNEPRGGFLDSKMEDGCKDHRHHEPGNFPEASSSNTSNHRSESFVEEFGLMVPCGTTEAKDRNCDQSEGPKSHSPMIDAIGKIDKDKVKAALEKRRKSRAEVARKVDIVDDDDLIERELESGIELAAEDERIKQERSSWSESYKQEPHDTDHGAENGNRWTETKISKEEELLPESREFHPPEPSSRKRRAVSPGKASGEKDGYDLHYHAALPSKHQDSLGDTRAGRPEHAGRDHKRSRLENHV